MSAGRVNDYPTRNPRITFEALAIRAGNYTPRTGRGLDVTKGAPVPGGSEAPERRVVSVSNGRK
jgi:hypothetical protein